MATYYVSPTGSDEGPGTLSQPFGSLQHAHDSARPGDTIYMRGGTYALTQGIRLTNDGTSQNPITVCNYPGETPVLDGSAMTRAGYQGVVLTLESASFNHIKGLEITGAPESGLVIRNASHNNTIEGLDVHHNGRLSEWEGKGICLYGPASNNLLLNNDSHHNRDLHGDNADGFQVSTTGQGNVLRGNRPGPTRTTGSTSSTCTTAARPRRS
jgi:Right handed beta helix region